MTFLAAGLQFHGAAIDVGAQVAARLNRTEPVSAGAATKGDPPTPSTPNNPYAEAESASNKSEIATDARLRISLSRSTEGTALYRLPYESDSVFVIAIPKSCRPSLESEATRSVTIRTNGNDVVFSFPIRAGAQTTVTAIKDGVEISFGRSSVAGGDSIADETAGVQKQPEPISLIRRVAMASAGAGSLPTHVASPFATPEPRGATEAVTSAQAVAKPGDSNISNANIDLSVPESPAFTVLGLTPQTVVRPASPRDLATTLLNGVDDRGNFQSGLALDTSPYLLFAGRLLTINKYRSSPMVRFLSNTQLSFATTKGASDDDKAMRMALGAHLTIFDKGDPRLDRQIDECYERDIPNFENQPVSPTLPPEAREAIRVSRRDAIRAAAASCQEKARARNWNNTSWIIAAAPSWLSKTGETGDFQYNGAGVWTSFAYGFEGIPGMEDTSQLILHARYRNKELVPATNAQGQFFLEDSVYLGGRFRVGKPDFIGNFEAVYLRNKPEHQRYDAAYRISVGAERKVANNLWFTVSFGGNGGRSDGHNKGFVLTSFKWALSPKPDPSIIQ
jgi:hypothetical protein